MINFGVIHALVLRYLYLFTRTPIRLIELLFWPIVQLLVWGYLTTYLQRNTDAEFSGFITFLIGAVIFWDVLFRSQQAVAIYFLEDVWTRNVLNVFVAPIRTVEYLGATFTVGIMRTALTVTILSLISYGLYHFNILSLHWALFPFVFNLLLFGWSLGMISTALIVRWGPAAETLAWATPFLIQPFACVFYPLSELPAWMQWISASLPATHVFEGMRAILKTGELPVTNLVWAFGLNAAYMAGAGWLFGHVLKVARIKGLLTKFASQ